MKTALKLGKYSIGVGDRFAHQAEAQLRACLLTAQAGAEVIPVWNKSNREHLTIGSEPATTRQAADDAVRNLHWRAPYHVDADHIRLETVDRFLPCSDFFTIDVADSIGKSAATTALQRFVASHPELTGTIEIPGIAQPLQWSRAKLAQRAAQYLLAVQDAGRIYRRIVQAKGAGRFITEVSMDETDSPQTPGELLMVLAALADEGVPAQTIAPKFAGRFNKGVDYVGEVSKFEQEFRADLAVISFATSQYALPQNLKLSVHSGSDKFSIYGPMRWAMREAGAGVHLKTAGTTWLEEVIGLAEAGGDGLALAQEIYTQALDHLEDLCAPYATVIDIDQKQLPGPATVKAWSSAQFVAALRHDPSCVAYNPHLRQLLHVAYKVAAQMGSRYLQALQMHQATIARNVTENLFERHLKPLFL